MRWQREVRGETALNSKHPLPPGTRQAVKTGLKIFSAEDIKTAFRQSVFFCKTFFICESVNVNVIYMII